MTRTELEYQIWTDLGYLEAKTPTGYQQHLWLTIHNQKEKALCADGV